jgi:GrpB-like predicted nucleotidyltransferase (UPF0157 family)
VIDLDVVVRSPEDVPGAIERLRRLGYAYLGDQGIPGREALLRPLGAVPHHLYVVVAGSRPLLDHLRFRDHLRAHPQTAQAYAALKRELARRHTNDRVAYTDAKSEFVARVLAGAVTPAARR